eukprot:727629_1
MSSDEFIETCDRILHNEEMYELDDDSHETYAMDDEHQEIDNMDVKALPYYNITAKVVVFVQKYARLSLYSLRLISTIFTAASVLVISYFVNDIDCLV